MSDLEGGVPPGGPRGQDVPGTSGPRPAYGPPHFGEPSGTPSYLPPPEPLRYEGQQPYPGPYPPPQPYGAPHPQVPSGPAPVPRPSFPHPEPREYHLMLRTWTYRWWRPVVGMLLLALGMLVVVPLLALPVLIVGVLIEGGQQDFLDAFLSAGTFQTLTPSGLLYLNLTLGGMILWSWALIRLLHQMRPRWLSSVVPRLRWRFLFVCFGLAVVALVAQFVVGALVPADGNPDVNVAANPLTGTTVALLLVVLFTTPLQAAGEEFAFRGYLLQAVGSLTRSRWVAMLATATIFAMAHGLQNPPLFFDRFMFGLIAGWLVIRTGGLEAGIALHVLNNYLAFTLAIFFGNIDDTLNVSSISWWNIPVTLTQSLVYAGLVAWVASRMGLQRRTRPPVPQAQEQPVL